MKKRITSFLLAAFLLCSLCAGCAGGGETAASASPAASASAAVAEPEASASPEASAAPAESAAPEETAAEQSPAAETAASVPPLSDIYPLSDELTTLTYWQAWPPFLATYCEPQDSGAFKALTEATNVELEVTWVDTETASEKFNLMIATGEYPDLIQGLVRNYTGGGTQAIEDGVVYDLWKYAGDNMPYFMNAVGDNEDIRRSLLDDDGQMAQVYGLYNDYYYTDQGMWVRQDFLDKVGLGIPNTLEELETVLGAFKSQMNLSDPCVLLAEGNLNFLSVMYDAGTQVLNGELVDYSLSDNMKSYLKKLHEWWEKGYVNSDFMSNSYSDTKPPEELVYQDQGGMFNEDVASISTYAKNSENPDFLLVAMPQTLLTADQQLKTGYIPKLVSDKYTISVSTCCTQDELPIALHLLDYMYTDEGLILGNYGIEGDTWEYDDNGNIKFTDFIMNHKLGYQGAQSAFINPGIPCLIDLSVNELSYNDQQKEAVDIWCQNFAGNESTVPTYSLNTEETTQTATLQTDIDTYVEEMRLKFIMGEADIDAEWDTYVKTIKDMGYDTIMEIRQGAFERYLAK